MQQSMSARKASLSHTKRIRAADRFVEVHRVALGTNNYRSPAELQQMQAALTAKRKQSQLENMWSRHGSTSWNRKPEEKKKEAALKALKHEEKKKEAALKALKTTCKENGDGGGGIKDTCEHGSKRCLYCTTMQKQLVVIQSPSLGIGINVLSRDKASGSKHYRDKEIQPWAAPSDDYVVMYIKHPAVCAEIKKANIPLGARLSFINGTKVTSSEDLHKVLRSRGSGSVTIRFDFTPPSAERTKRWGE
jgi:hypothetical protein